MIDLQSDGRCFATILFTFNSGPKILCSLVFLILKPPYFVYIYIYISKGLEKFSPHTTDSKIAEVKRKFKSLIYISISI